MNAFVVSTNFSIAFKRYLLYFGFLASTSINYKEAHTIKLEITFRKLGFELIVADFHESVKRIF